MKRIVLGLSAAVAGALGAPAVGADATAPAPISIYFNDRHVAAADRLERGRVLAALVRGDTVLIPLRSVFEQAGASVIYDPATRGIEVTKPGVRIRLRVGQPQIEIDAQRRPLDVAPEIVNETVLVPLRVIAEGLGAYVQWLPERRSVVVRYLSAPAPAATAEPQTTPLPEAATPLPLPVATPAAPRARTAHGEAFIVGDDLFATKVDNEFSPGNAGVGVSYSVRAALEWRIGPLPLMIAGDYRRFRYPHDSTGSDAPGAPGLVTVIGRYGQTDVPAFAARDTDVNARIGIRVARPRIYLAAGLLHLEDTYGYPKQNGAGAGIEALPDLARPFSFYASGFYFPHVSASFAYPQDLVTCPLAVTAGCPPGSLFGTSATLTDSYLWYRLGVTLALTSAARRYGMFLDAGLTGDRVHAGALAPSNAAHVGGYAGLGLKL